MLEESHLKSQPQMRPLPEMVEGDLPSQRICLHRPVEAEHEIWIVILEVGRGTVAGSLVLVVVVAAAIVAGRPLVFAMVEVLEEGPFDQMM